MKAETGKRYRHYKGGEYTVLSIARLESDPERLCVVYRAEYETEFGAETVWIRPIEDFESDVATKEGNVVPRFMKIDDV